MAAVAANPTPGGNNAPPLDDALEARLARKRAFTDFLEFVDPADGWSLAEQIAQDMVEHSPKTGEAVALKTDRLNVQIHRLRAWNPSLAQELLDKPAEVLPGFEDAVRDFARASPHLAKLVPADAEIRVGLLGDFGAAEVSPRELSSRQLGKLVKVFGIVTRCSLVRPKIVRSVHYCPATGLTSSKDYRDVTALTGLPTGEREFCPCRFWGGGGVA
jgi:DNA replication licensing factor MCM3